MRIAVCSDLHLEFGDLDLTNNGDADVLILSGDIFVASDLQNYQNEDGLVIPVMQSAVTRGKRYNDFIMRCCERFPKVLMVSGNHEHYHGNFHTTHDIIRTAFGDLPNFHFLDKEHVVIGDVLFYGGTLWTDMNNEDPMTMLHMRGMMNDYVQIKNTGPTAGGKFIPEDSVEDHYEFRRGLDETLEQFPNMPVVVVGHHAPSKASTHPRYKTEFMMNGAYSTDLDEFVLDRRQIKLWTHGHTHEPFDYMLGTTRVVCNPRGYDGHEQRADDFELKYLEI